MRNQVVALEYKADGMITITVPVRILKLLCGYAVNNQITLGILIQTAHNVQQCGLTAAGLTQYRYKLALPKLNADTL